MDKDFLFIYDITDSKILNKIVKRIGQFNSIRIQNSTFELKLSDDEKIKFMNEIAKTINEDRDKVMLIPICKNDYYKTHFLGIPVHRLKKVEKYIIL